MITKVAALISSGTALGLTSRELNAIGQLQSTVCRSSSSRAGPSPAMSKRAWETANIEATRSAPSNPFSTASRPKHGKRG
jgi:hypothetical protein